MKRTLLAALFGLLLCGSTTAQVQNYCLRLSQGGSVDCGSMPELDGLKTFTLQFWMNVTTWTEDATVLSRGEGLAVRLGKSGALKIIVGENTYSVSSTEFGEGKWCQVTLLAKGESLQVMVNNQSVREMTLKSAIPETGSNFIIGGDAFHGRLDEVRVWDTTLPADYDYFTGTTLNKWVPELEHLVAYYKFDQAQCSNVVDYKALFAPRQKTNHHGIMSARGVARAKVTDNPRLPYLLVGGYTNNVRFYDRAIEKEKYLLANDLIILGIQSYSDGHLRYLTTCEHGKVRNGEYMAEYLNRQGVLSLKGAGASMECPTTLLNPGRDNNNKVTFTFETWIYLEEWTEGAYLFRKEDTAGTKGFSIRLGAETNRQVIVRVDGRDYVYTSALTKGRWVHLAVMPGAATNNTNTFALYYNGRSILANRNLSNESTDFTPSSMADYTAWIGVNLNAKLDETAIWNRKFDEEELKEHREGTYPMPGFSTTTTKAMMDATSGYYRYDDPANVGWDYYSQDNWKKIMESAYNGYSGYQIRISVQGHETWISTIADANKRKIFAADLAELSKPYDGVELDLEWMDGTQTNLGLLADEILKVLPKGKSFMISHHQYGAYQFPKGKIANIDGFTFQQYGNEKEWYGLQAFKNGYNAFRNYGYPNDKIYLSWGATTSAGYNDNDKRVGAIIGYNWGIIGSDYEPATDGSRERAIYNGLNYYFCGPVQVYNRAKFVRENNLKGLFYWDMCNDLAPSHKYSLARWCNYALCANVDPLVKEVEVNHPTGIRGVGEKVADEADGIIYDLQGRRLLQPAQKGISIQNGRKVLR